MAPSGVDNDTRGWIMCIVSGIACIVGASIICVDIVINLIPGQRNFRIQESNAFLASSLSLSFGVMLFSALFSMLPSSKRYLAKDEWDTQTAGFIMMGCFVAGFVGIQIISRILHQFMPSHVVDCDHTHQDKMENLEEGGHDHSGPHSRRPSRMTRGRRRSLGRRLSSHAHVHAHTHAHFADASIAETHGHTTERTPLIATEAESNGHGHPELPHRSQTTMLPAHSQTHVKSRSRAATTTSGNALRRPSMLQVQNRVMSFVKDTKANCDEDGPCFGYSDPCGQECFKHLATRSALNSRAPTFLRTGHGTFQHGTGFPGLLEDENESTSPISPTVRTSRAQSRDTSRCLETHLDEYEPHEHPLDDEATQAGDENEICIQMDEEDLEAQHHHHVPTNAFLSIGLQTVIAIALHKFPEGFITYATNHANPSLGFSVFMALFVHNIAEGFSMALPLYMALGSRLKAIMWSSLLGGLSQPLGAGLAVLWFKLANRSNLHIDNTAYACLFAATAGIMTSVALQLFVESLSLNHNRNLSILFAFLGMTLLGVSSALVTE